jgi:MFS family permease
MRNEELQDQSTADLLKRLSEQTSALVRQEIRLAQLELQEKGKRAGIGAGLFGASGLVALYALGALIAGLILLLATAVEAWAAALIVAGVLAMLAGVLVLTGRKEVQEATPPAPEQTIESVKQDVDEVKARART